MWRAAREAKSTATEDSDTTMSGCGRESLQSARMSTRACASWGAERAVRMTRDAPASANARAMLYITRQSQCIIRGMHWYEGEYFADAPARTSDQHGLPSAGVFQDSAGVDLPGVVKSLRNVLRCSAYRWVDIVVKSLDALYDSLGVCKKFGAFVTWSQTIYYVCRQALQT